MRPLNADLNSYVNAYIRKSKSKRLRQTFMCSKGNNAEK